MNKKHIIILVFFSFSLLFVGVSQAQDNRVSDIELEVYINGDKIQAGETVTVEPGEPVRFRYKLINSGTESRVPDIYPFSEKRAHDATIFDIGDKRTELEDWRIVKHTDSERMIFRRSGGGYSDKRHWECRTFDFDCSIEPGETEQTEIVLMSPEEAGKYEFASQSRDVLKIFNIQVKDASSGTGFPWFWILPIVASILAVYLLLKRKSGEDEYIQ